jgi:hypothetical protein
MACALGRGGAPTFLMKARVICCPDSFFIHILTAPSPITLSGSPSSPSHGMQKTPASAGGGGGFSAGLPSINDV